MSLLTTTIGSYPKPDYVPVKDWFHTGAAGLANPTKAYDRILHEAADEMEEILIRATHEVVSEQVDLGIDVPTDGEVRRENYIYYFCRHLEGIDFSYLSGKVMRAGAWEARVPTITGPIQPLILFMAREWRIAQEFTQRPVKATLPGPMTVTDSTADAHYGDEKRLGADLAKALNQEIRVLADAGCEWIQVDEPLLAREPEKALAFGIENLERCFHGVESHVKRTVHICCGYPNYVDQEDFLKADLKAYFKLAPALESSSIGVVSLEDAHRNNDLRLLEHFTTTKIIFGAVDIARSKVESVEKVRGRLSDALERIDAERLIVAPDCGLGMLDRNTAKAKLANMVAAARDLG